MKAIRLHIKQSSANYRREETVNCRMTYPLPPFSTVIGAVHKACGYTKYHPMQVSVQGKYGSLKRRMFKEDCFLNSLQDDRNILVKMVNPDMLSSAYQVVATAQKAQGNSFDKGITINVVNQDLLDEYRFLNRTKRRIDKNKGVIKAKKAKLKAMKSDENISKEELKSFSDKVKTLEKAYKKYEEEKYTKPKSMFRTLAKAPKQCEILCNVELVIHITSDEQTMQDILENAYNITAIGRGEDFIELIDVCETELTKPDEKTIIESKYGYYIPCEYVEKLYLTGAEEGMIKNGTKYLINKNYTLEEKQGSRKRIFNKIPVLYTSDFAVWGSVDGVYVDKLADLEIPVLLG